MESTRFESGYGQGRESLHGRFDQAEAALSANKPAEAETGFDAILRYDPFNVRAHCGLSRAYWGQGRTEDALNSLTRALELEPNDQETILQFSRACNTLGKKDFAREVLQSYLDRNPHAEAIRTEAQSLEGPTPTEDPGQREIAELFRKQGTIQFERGRLDHAIACLEMAIENNPVLAGAHNDLGVIHFQNGNIKEALRHLYNALELDSKDPEILGNSARVLALAGETETAEQMYKEYLRLSPEDDAAWGEYEALLRRGPLQQWDESSLTPEVAGIYIDAAKKLMDAGDLAGAAGAIERALKIRPGAVEAMFVLASLHAGIGHREDAADLLEQALEIDPSDADCSALLKSLRNGNGDGPGLAAGVPGENQCPEMAE